MLVTSAEREILALAQVYRDRADAENTFDELKNPRGWRGCTSQDLARCRIMARMVALVSNLWTLFVGLAQPHEYFEAISSRPLLLHDVATHTQHAGQTHLTITSLPAKQVGHTSGADRFGGISECTESRSGAVDRCRTPASDSRSQAFGACMRIPLPLPLSGVSHIFTP